MSTHCLSLGTSPLTLDWRCWMAYPRRYYPRCSCLTVSSFVLFSQAILSDSYSSVRLPVHELKVLRSALGVDMNVVSRDMVNDLKSRTEGLKHNPRSAEYAARLPGLVAAIREQQIERSKVSWRPSHSFRSDGAGCFPLSSVGHRALSKDIREIVSTSIWRELLESHFSCLFAGVSKNSCSLSKTTCRSMS